LTIKSIECIKLGWVKPQLISVKRHPRLARKRTKKDATLRNFAPENQLCASTQHSSGSCAWPFFAFFRLQVCPLPRGERMSQQTPNNPNALLDAAANGDIDKTRNLLLAGTPVDVTDEA
jgi:hypothetical protein